MNIQPDHLLCFAAVARAGSVTHAAEALNRSQPAVSAQLRQLTSAVGTTLYQRHRGGVALTPAGKELLPHALAVQRGIERAKTWALAHQAGTGQPLRIAASLTAAEYLVPPLMAALRRDFPEAPLQLLSRNSAQVLNLLLWAEAEVGIVEGQPPKLPSDLEARPLWADELLLVAAPGTPWAHQPELSELADWPLVHREEGSGTRELTAAALQRAGIAPKTAAEATGTQAVLELVRQKLGVAFVSRLAAERDLAAGTLVGWSLPELGLRRTLTLLLPRPTAPLPPLERFLELLEAEACQAKQSTA